MSTYAEVPCVMNYQGRLLDGTNLVSGSYPIAFSIHTNATGGATLFACTNAIQVVDGLYSTYIGENPVAGTLTNALKYSPLYLQVEIDGTILSPRERLAAVTYAMVAAAVPNGAITTDMLGSQCVDADKIVNGSIGAEDLSSNISTVYVARAGSTMTGLLQLPTDGFAVGDSQLAATNGGVIMKGDLEITDGAFKGNVGSGGAPFPRPAYDSGWISQPLHSSTDFSHSLGGDVNDYFVDLQAANSNMAVVYPGPNAYYYSSGADHGYKISVETNKWTMINLEVISGGPTNFRCRIWIVK